MLSSSKAEQLASQLQEDIDRGTLAAGAFLGTKGALRELHGVSAGTLNEALRLLQVRGYIYVRPGPKGGCFVSREHSRLKVRHTYLEARTKPETVAMYLQVREHLESLVVTEAAEACNDSDGERLRTALERLRTARSADEVVEADWDLHREVAKTGQNWVLSDIYCGLLDQVQDSVAGYSRSGSVQPGVNADTLVIHEDLVEAVIQRDVRKAKRRAMMHSPLGWSE